jgi:hypothetical protein
MLDKRGILNCQTPGGTLSNVTVDIYKVLSRAVEEGIPGGYRKAFKHTDTPSEEQIFGSIYDYVMMEICEVLQFGNSECECDCCEK